MAMLRVALLIIAGANAIVPDACTKQPEERTFAMVLDNLSRESMEVMSNSSAIADMVRQVGMSRDDHRPLYGREKMYMHKRFGYGLFQLPEQVGCGVPAKNAGLLALSPSRVARGPLGSPRSGSDKQ